MAELWLVTIKSLSLSLSTKIDPSETIRIVLDRISGKFPESKSSNNFSLFFETSKEFLLLDENSLVGSFESLKNGVTILYFFSFVFKKI